MLVLGVLSLIIGANFACLTADSALKPIVTADTTPGHTVLATAQADSPHVRPRVVEVSEWYGRRLTIHRYVSYATIPVFAAQWAAGERLFKDGRDAPTWAKSVHRAGATTLAGMFTVNTVTGIWNWWDSRSVKQGRALRTVHSLSMLAADGAFTYAGAKLSNEAETSLDKRKLHRTIAVSAMGVTLVSEITMKLLNR
jgi:hypothetical protein